MKRRHFIQAAATTAFAASHSALFAIVDKPNPSRVIDTHTHFYDPTRPQGVPWPPDKASPLYRTVLPKDFLKVASPLGVRNTVVVEASEWVEDNQWVLDLAQTNPSIIGLVGNLDPNDPKFKSHLDRFSKNKLFRGIRWRDNLVPFDGDFGRLETAAKQLSDLDLELDLLGPFTKLPAIDRLARAVPMLRMVINHAAHPGDPKMLDPKWKEQVAQIAQHPNVFMKVSGLIEQVKGVVGKSPADTQYYLPVLDHLWERFGEDRLIYGSNWPVSESGGPYESSYAVVHEYFSGKGPEATEKYFWKNSLAVYRWIDR
jgi:L-fuconolactonase